MGLQRTHFPVVYLTGAPATGKSTLAKNLLNHVSDLKIFTYSEELRKFMHRKLGGDLLTEDSIRKLSAKVITAEDVAQLDLELVDEVARQRVHRCFVIDSHPVTKESYGFRVTGFNVATLLKLNPDVIVCLYALPEVIRERISRDAMGRPMPSQFEAEMHTHLQTAVAAQYGVLTGKPVYFLDSSCSQEELVAVTIKRIGL